MISIILTVYIWHVVGDYILDPRNNKWYTLLLHWMIYFLPFILLYGINKPINEPLIWFIILPHIILDILEYHNAMYFIISQIYKYLFLLAYSLCIWCYM